RCGHQRGGFDGVRTGRGVPPGHVLRVRTRTSRKRTRRDDQIRSGNSLERPRLPTLGCGRSLSYTLCMSIRAGGAALLCAGLFCLAAVARAEEQIEEVSIDYR